MVNTLFVKMYNFLKYKNLSTCESVCKKASILKEFSMLTFWEKKFFFKMLLRRIELSIFFS